MSDSLDILNWITKSDEPQSGVKIQVRHELSDGGFSEWEDLDGTMYATDSKTLQSLMGAIHGWATSESGTALAQGVNFLGWRDEKDDSGKKVAYYSETLRLSFPPANEIDDKIKDNIRTNLDTYFWLH